MSTVTNGAPRRSGYMRFPALCLAAVAVALPGCGNSDDGSPGDELWGLSFVSTKVERGGQPADLVPDSRITVYVRSEKERILAWDAGCNRFGGQLSVTGSHLSVGSASQTEMLCSDGLMAQEEWVSRFFTDDPGWQLEGNRLALENGRTVIHFRRLPS
jgi:heat shock protein HslJ